MSGHSKWSTIKRKKGAADAARGKVFTKIGREIAMAVRGGGPDPASNSRLRDAIARARAANMPNDNIQRNIKKFSGADGEIHYEENTYEGYGPGGVAVIVETLTDNAKRTVADVRHAFDKSGGNLGATGCVGWMFTRRGQLVIDRAEFAKYDEDEFMMLALDAGAEDVVVSEDVFEVLTEPGDFSAVREALEAGGLSFLSAEIAMIPANTQALPEDEAGKVQAMIDRLDELDDVQRVYHNGELPEEDEEE